MICVSKLTVVVLSSKWNLSSKGFSQLHAQNSAKLLLFEFPQFWGNEGQKEETWGLSKKLSCFTTELMVVFISFEHTFTDSRQIAQLAI